MWGPPWCEIIGNFCGGKVQQKNKSWIVMERS